MGNASPQVGSASNQPGMRVRKADVVLLRITKSTLKERKRRQFRNSMNIGDRELEPGWGYLKRFGSVVCIWAQAINLDLTDWWLRRLEKDDVGSVQLIEFLEWVLEQRRRRAARHHQYFLSRTSPG